MIVIVLVIIYCTWLYLDHSAVNFIVECIIFMSSINDFNNIQFKNSILLPIKKFIF